MSRGLGLLLSLAGLGLLLEDDSGTKASKTRGFGVLLLLAGSGLLLGNLEEDPT